MIVSGWVSSKSRRFAEIALRNEAHIASIRSEWPMMVAVAAPVNGDNVRIAAATTGSRAEPSAVAKKLRIDRRASWLCASTSAHDEAATKSASVLLTLVVLSCGTRGVFLVFRKLMPIRGKLSTQMLCLTACQTIITICALARDAAARNDGGRRDRRRPDDRQNNYQGAPSRDRATGSERWRERRSA